MNPSELQQQIDAAEQQTVEELQMENEGLKEEVKDGESEIEIRDAMIEELLELARDLAELAYVVDPSAVEYLLLRSNELSWLPSDLRVGAQVRQAALPFGKAANGCK